MESLFNILEEAFRYQQEQELLLSEMTRRLLDTESIIYTPWGNLHLAVDLNIQDGHFKLNDRLYKIEIHEIQTT